MKTQTVITIILSAILLSLTGCSTPPVIEARHPAPSSLASAAVTVLRSSGVVCDNVNFKNLKATQDGDSVTVEFDYNITGKNKTEINQMLVATNGKVIGFVSEGMLGDGKSGHGSVTFLPIKNENGKCHILLGACFDYTTEQAKSQFEKGHGYRLEVGYVE